MAVCLGKTKSGTRCKNKALPEEKYCRLHLTNDEKANAREKVTSTSTTSSPEGIEKWVQDQTTVTTIGGATLGAFVGGPVGALVGGAIGAFLGNYHQQPEKKEEE